MLRKVALAAMIPAFVLASMPAFALGFDLPHLTFPPAQTGAGSASGR
jgi:hypothetical protein